MDQLAPEHGLLLPMPQAVGKDSAAACISGLPPEAQCCW